MFTFLEISEGDIKFSGNSAVNCYNYDLGVDDNVRGSQAYRISSWLVSAAGHESIRTVSQRMGRGIARRLAVLSSVQVSFRVLDRAVDDSVTSPVVRPFEVQVSFRCDWTVGNVPTATYTFYFRLPRPTNTVHNQWFKIKNVLNPSWISLPLAGSLKVELDRLRYQSWMIK